MQCTACERESPAGARFCMYCAAPFVLACVGCGAELPAEARFCPQCARAVEGGVAVPPQDVNADAGAVRDPRSYTPAHLADRILRSRSALEGERKQVSVLFADVRNSMELAAAVDAETWHGILDCFFQTLADGIHRFEGTINQYTGDGVMALFGAPLAHEDHAQRACYAALQLTETVAELASELRREHGLDFQMRVGLNSGEVVVGKIGDDLRMDYTAQGETVGLAQRMEGLAETGRPYLTQATAALAEGWLALEDLGDFKVKGAAAPLRVFALDGVGKVRTRLDLSQARGFSRFVGRADDLATLEAALERAGEGQGQVLGIVADAGVGKSRLCHELVTRCRARGLAVRESHAVAHGKNIPLLPVLELLRDVFGIDSRDADAVVRQKIAGTVVLRDQSLQGDLPLLFEFMGVGDPANPAPSLASDERDRRLDGLLRQLFQARSRDEAAVYLIEDLHWLDEASERFLERMCEATPGTRTLVLVNFRPEYEAPWSGRSYYQQLPLRPLGADATLELLDDLLGGDSSLGDLSGRIQSRAAGNPFFIEEIVRALAGAGNLEGERGAYRLATAVDQLVLPQTVEALLAARIDRVAERDKHVLQTAAVAGKQFARRLLDHVSDLPGGELDDALRSLVEAEFVHEREIYPEVEYEFRHPLTQDVAYRSLLGERRRTTHARVARAIEALEPERLEEKAALLAHHCELAGEELAAARWHARAAETFSRTAPPECLRHWRRVHELAGGLADGEEPLRLQLASVTGILINALRAGARGGLSELIDEGRALSGRLGEAEAEAEFLANAAFAIGAMARPAEAAEVGLQAVERADAAGNDLTRMGIRARVSPFVLLGDPRAAMRLSGEALAILESLRAEGRELSGSLPFVVEGMGGMGLSWAGRLEPARSALARSLEGLAREGDEVMRCVIAAFTAQCENWRGDAVAAATQARQSIESARRVGNVAASGLGYQSLADALMQSGQYEEAERVLDEGLEVMTHGGTRALTPSLLGTLAECHAKQGRLERATELAERASELAAGPTAVANTTLSLARVRRLRHGASALAEIEAELLQVESLAREHGLSPLVAATCEDQARAAALRDDGAGLAAGLRAARELYAELGAPGHVERLDHEIASLVHT